MKIEDLRKIHEAATPGPWEEIECNQSDLVATIFIDEKAAVSVSTWDARGAIDAEFIAQARNHFEALLDTLVIAESVINDLAEGYDHVDTRNGIQHNGVDEGVVRMFDFVKSRLNKYREALEKLEAIK